MAKAASKQTFLEFRDLHCGEDYTPPLSLGLAPGELVMLNVDEDFDPSVIGDLALGMDVPMDGSVSIRGGSWGALDPHLLDQQRLKTGRVFDSQRRVAWLENLDVDENILLAQSFQPEMTQETLLKRAQKLADDVGLQSLPHSRPSITPKDVLTLAQWVRALLPDPLELLILESPLEHLEPEQQKPLLDQVGRVRKQGTAVLWVDRPLPASLVKQLDPTQTIDTFETSPA